MRERERDTPTFFLVRTLQSPGLPLPPPVQSFIVFGSAFVHYINGNTDISRVVRVRQVS